jgi:protein ImuA
MLSVLPAPIDLAALEGRLLWRAGRMAEPPALTAATGWSALDAELPGGGWPLAGMTELLIEPAAGELALLAPWLGRCSEPLLWIAPPGWPCVAALRSLGLAVERLVCVDPARAADAAWAAEQGLRAGRCAAVLWWQAGPIAAATLRRLHLAAQAGTTPLIALRAPAERSHSSPAPLRLACAPQPDYRLAVEVFKRRGPPMAAPLRLTLPWPGSVRPPVPERHDAVDRPAPAPVATASPARLAARV